MGSFYDRREELTTLNLILARPRAQCVIVSGLRRQGKTSLVTHWAKESGRPYLYWLARRETPEATRQSLARALYSFVYQKPMEPPKFTGWEQLFRQMIEMIQPYLAQGLIIIFDEFTDAAESDSSLPSHVQALWDHDLQDTKAILVLTGSHLGMMEKLQGSDAPLYGRATARLQVDPLPFAALQDFFPHYPADKRVALYAVLGGVPAYLLQFDPNQGLSANVRQHLFQQVGMFRTEPASLIGDLVRETRRYEAILAAVAKGQRTATDIAAATQTFTSNVTPYLKALTTLGLLERRISPLVPPAKRAEAIRGAGYYLRMPYLRFYYRLVEPNLEMIELGLTDVLWKRIEEDFLFRAFVGETAWEDLCRAWVLNQARANLLAFPPELVGSHRASDVQIDVVAINWRQKAILLGECKWDDEKIHLDVIKKLIDRAPLVVPGADWKVHFYWFSRVGFTDAALAEIDRVGGKWVDLEMVDRDLRREYEGSR